MLHIIDNHNKAFYTDTLQEMFELRHQVFVKHLGWKALEKDDGLEIDQFDTDDAVYLVAFDEEGGLAGSIRMMPTTSPHLLADVLPHFCTRKPLIRDEKVWEYTRYMVAPKLNRTPDSYKVTSRLIAGIIEYGVVRGLDGFVCVCDINFMKSVSRNKFPFEPLGLATPFDEGTAIAGYSEISPAILSALRVQFGLPPIPVTGYHYGWQPERIAA